MARRRLDLTQRQRLEEILRLLRSAQRVDVTDLTVRFGVSDMTIRRDLAALETSGQVRRVHGGAVPARAQPYEYRADQQPAAKARIAAATAELIGPDAAVGIDIGTTCRAVAQSLADRDDLFVVTNSLHAAIEFRHSTSKVLVTGGLLTAELSLTGGTTTGAIHGLHLDHLVLSCGGVSAEHGVTYFDLAETEVRRALLDGSENVILAADHTKLDARKAVHLAGLDAIGTLVTDRRPSGELAAALERHGVRVVLA